MKDQLNRIFRWLHPELIEKDAEFRSTLDAQALIGTKLLGVILLTLAVSAQLLLRSLYSADNVKTEEGLLLAYRFMALGSFMLLVLRIPPLRTFARGILLAVMFFILADSLSLQLRLFPIHKAQLGLFISALCFIAFTFLPYRPWVIGVFGLFGLSVIIVLARGLGLALHPHTNTSLFWLIAEFLSLALITIFFRSAILNMQIRLFTMQEDIEDIKMILARAEGQRVEFKASFRYDYHQNQANVELAAHVIRAVAGFSNSGGGSVILGVDDGGRPVGLEKDYLTLKKKNRDGYELALGQAVSEAMGAQICQNLKYSFHDMEGKDICVIRVRAAVAPVYVDRKNQSIFYIRTGNSTQALDTKRAVEYINSHWKNPGSRA